MTSRNQTLATRQLNSLDKNGRVDLEEAQARADNHEAFLRIQSNPKNRPLSYIIPEDLAAVLEESLEPYARLHGKTRVALYKLVVWSLTEGNWAKTQGQMRIELNMSINDLKYWESRWPQLWKVINALARHKSSNEMGRVLGSMTNAAIYGDNRDRRLYLEYHGLIRRELPEASGGKTIIFVNDNLNRPAPKVIDVEGAKDEWAEGD